MTCVGPFLRSLVVASVLVAGITGARAQEWYIPQQSSVLEAGKIDVGTRLQFMVDRSGNDWDRRVDGILNLRFAPTRRLEFYVEGPYSYIEQERTVFPFLLHSTDQEGIGDIFSQVSYDLVGREDWRVMVTVDGVYPTGKNTYEDRRLLGDGFYKVAPGLTYVKVIDPAALFFYAGHQWTIPRSFTGFGKVEPGEDFRFRMGLSMMFHPRLRASVYTAGDVIGHTRLRGVQIAGTDRDVIRVGGSVNWAVADRWRMDWSSSFGMTDNAADAVIALGLTYSLR